MMTGLGISPAVDPPAGARSRQRAWATAGLVILALLLGVGLAYAAVQVSFIVSLGILAALIIGAVVLRNPETGLLVLVFAIPLEDFNQLGVYGELSPIKLMGIAMLGAYLIHYLVFQRNERLLYVPQNLYLALFFMSVLATDVIAVAPSNALDVTFKLLRMIAFYFLVVNIVRTEGAVKRVMWAMILAGVLSAGYGMFEYYFHPERLDEMRITGTLDDPTNFAYAMVVLVPMIWYLLTHSRRTLVKVGLAAAGVLFLYGIVLSGTRSAMLAAAGVILLIALREKRPVLSLGAAAVILVLALIYMPDQIKSRLGLSAEMDKAAQASTERRLTYLQFGAGLILERPVLGRGMGGFAQEYSQSDYQYLRTGSEVPRIAHNMYMEIAIGTGLVGLIPFLLLVFSPLFGLQGVMSLKRFGPPADLAKTIQVSLIAYLVVGLFSSSQYDKTLWLLVSLAALMPAIAHRRLEEPSENSSWDEEGAKDA